MRVHKKIYSCCFFVALFAMAGCDQRSEIEKTTQKYLEGFYSYDFESLYDITTEKTLDVIKEMESGMRGSVDLDQVAVPEIVTHEYYVVGDTAYCRYTLMQDSDDTNALSENLMLIKKDNKWLVEYKFY